MNERAELTETEIRTITASFLYPATPDLSSAVRLKLEKGYGRRPLPLTRLAWAALLVLILLAGMMVVPQVRAAIFRIFNIGAITIFEMEEVERPITDSTEIVAVKPTIAPLVPRDIALEVSLVEAQDLLASRSLYLPAYPRHLAEPDHIYWVDPQYQLTPTVISIWEDEGLALYQIGVAQFAAKGATIVAETTVNNQRAVWLDDPHYFWLQNGAIQEWQYVDGHVLIWWHEAGITFRLEGAASLEEAIRIAESMQKLED